VLAGWGTLNNLHHQRHVQLAEDYSRLRRGNSNEVNAILNNTVLGLLNSKGRRDNAQARREIEYNPKLALELLLTNFLSTN